METFFNIDSYADLYELRLVRQPNQLPDVDNERQKIATEEDQHDHEQHDGQIVLPLLLVAQHVRPRRVGPPDLQEDPQVEHGQDGEGHEVHEGHVHPVYVDGYVGGVGAEVGDGEHGAVGVELLDVPLGQGEFEETGK